MKNVILASCFALIATACGSQQAQDSQTAGFPGFMPKVETSEREIFPVDGTLASVEAKSAAAPAMGLWSVVTVNFSIPCTQKYEGGSLTYIRRDNGKIEVQASAFASREKVVPSGSITCQSLSLVQEKISIPGIVAQNDVTLVNLVAGSADIPNETVSIVATPHVKVVETRSLCPQGSICVTDGTIVTLEITLVNCADKLGLVASRGTQANAAGAPIDLTVKAIEFVGKNATTARCVAPAVVRHIVSLPMLFSDKVNLTVLN